MEETRTRIKLHITHFTFNLSTHLNTDSSVPLQDLHLSGSACVSPKTFLHDLQSPSLFYLSHSLLELSVVPGDYT